MKKRNVILLIIALFACSTGIYAETGMIPCPDDQTYARILKAGLRCYYENGEACAMKPTELQTMINMYFSQASMEDADCSGQEGLLVYKTLHGVAGIVIEPLGCQYCTLSKQYVWTTVVAKTYCGESASSIDGTKFTCRCSSLGCVMEPDIYTLSSCDELCPINARLCLCPSKCKNSVIDNSDPSRPKTCDKESKCHDYCVNEDVLARNGQMDATQKCGGYETIKCPYKCDKTLATCKDQRAVYNLQSCDQECPFDVKICMCPGGCKYKMIDNSDPLHPTSCDLDNCPDYCLSRTILKYNGVRDVSGECAYPSEKVCDYGCDSSKGVCKDEPSGDCPEKCENDVSYYSGTKDANGKCQYKTHDCASDGAICNKLSSGAVCAKPACDMDAVFDIEQKPKYKTCQEISLSRICAQCKDLVTGKKSPVNGAHVMLSSDCATTKCPASIIPQSAATSPDPNGGVYSGCVQEGGTFVSPGLEQPAECTLTLKAENLDKPGMKPVSVAKTISVQVRELKFVQDTPRIAEKTLKCEDGKEKDEAKAGEDKKIKVKSCDRMKFKACVQETDDDTVRVEVITVTFKAVDGSFSGSDGKENKNAACNIPVEGEGCCTTEAEYKAPAVNQGSKEVTIDVTAESACCYKTLKVEKAITMTVEAWEAKTTLSLEPQTVKANDPANAHVCYKKPDYGKCNEGIDGAQVSLSDSLGSGSTGSDGCVDIKVDTGRPQTYSVTATAKKECYPEKTSDASQLTVNK